MNITKKELLDMVEILNKIEIKGETNIYFMYQLLSFLKAKLLESEKKESGEKE